MITLSIQKGLQQITCKLSTVNKKKMNIDILNPEQHAQLQSLIEGSSNIIITSHKSPDGDAIGATLGWAEYLTSIGKEPTIIVPDQFPDFLAWLPNSQKIVRYDKHREKCDLLFKIADLIPGPSCTHRPPS